MDMKHNIITQKSNNMLILTIEINYYYYFILIFILIWLVSLKKQESYGNLQLYHICIHIYNQECTFQYHISYFHTQNTIILFLECPNDYKLLEFHIL